MGGQDRAGADQVRDGGIVRRQLQGRRSWRRCKAAATGDDGGQQLEPEQDQERHGREHGLP